MLMHFVRSLDISHVCVAVAPFLCVLNTQVLLNRLDHSDLFTLQWSNASSEPLFIFTERQLIYIYNIVIYSLYFQTDIATPPHPNLLYLDFH